MYRASADIILPTSIIGSLPRPSWYTAGLGAQSFLGAMMNLRYREQYEDAVSVYLRAQETAGLDIVTDGDAHFDEQISGMSWQSYPLTHMAGFSQSAEPSPYQMGTGAPRGHILHDFLEARVLPKIIGPVGPGQSAVHSDVEGGAAVDEETGQVRNHPAGIARGVRLR